MFKVKDTDQQYNQARYEALGEVTIPYNNTVTFNTHHITGDNRAGVPDVRIRYQAIKNTPPSK